MLTIQIISDMLNKLLNKFLYLIRYIILKYKVKKISSFVRLGKHITILNPKCVIFGKIRGIGDYTFIGPVESYMGINYSPIVIIGDGTWIGKNCSIAAINKVEIGKNVLFAGNVHITDHNHGYEDISKPITIQTLISKGPVVIDDDCWLGYNSEILSGVHIGKHSIVAARAVVTKNVPPFSIVAGNPAKVIKQYNFELKKWVKIK